MVKGERVELVKIKECSEDILELRKTEDLLKEIDSKYALLSSEPNDIFALFSATRKIIYINSSVYKHIGYKPELLIDRDFSFLTTSDEINKFRDLVKKVKSQNVSSGMIILRMKKKGGGSAWFYTDILIIKGCTGNIIGYQCIFHNITEKVEAEKMLEEERRKVITSLIDGQEMERQRISMELHDGLGQTLAGVKMKLENSANYDLETTRKTINEVKKEFWHLIDEIRLMSTNVSPAILTNWGLVPALAQLCKQFEKSSGIKCEYSVAGDFSGVLEKRAFYIYRIVQEGFTNAAKHSKATILKLFLIEKEKNLLILIEDNGIGFNADDQKDSTGNGLLNIKQRVLLLDGQVNFGTIKNSGTIIFVRIPK